ncbi:MAG: DUF6069 family protein [Thermoflexibacter sp.]|jgi:hypothetical protein|nr:DUF6069 family protein [Thermoflexibacter sp.]
MSTQTVDYTKIALGGAKGIVVAVVVNAILFFIFSSLGVISEQILIQPANQPITIVPVVMASIVPSILATLFFMALVKFTKQPVKIFGIIALVLVVLSFASPFSIPTVTIAMAVVLNFMHAVVAGAIYWGLSKSV